MNTILNAPFKLQQAELQTELAIKPGSHFESILEKLIEKVKEIGKPKAIYRVSYVEANGNGSVTVEDTTFHSQAMSTNLKEIGRVFPFIATCGTEVDEIPIEEDDILQQYWLNTIKLSLLYASLEHLRETLRNRYRIENLSAMNPGSGDSSVWPIDQQQALFSLLGGTQVVNQKIGVHLLPTFLMVPEMSVSGILFPSETSYHNCQLCQREDCPGRQAHFDAEMWETVQRNN